MIKSYGDAATARFAETGKSKFSGMDAQTANRRLLLLKKVTKIGDLAVSGKLRLHGLSGNWQGYWSIDINGPWRVFFRFDGDVYDVTIIDPH